MYASHSKNINKNKSFHALSGKNQYIKAKKEEEEEERKAALEKRSATLASEKRAYAFDSMVRAADGGGGEHASPAAVKFTASSAIVDGGKRPREDGVHGQSDGRDRDARWMFKDDDHHHATTTTTPVASASENTNHEVDVGATHVGGASSSCTTTVVTTTGRITKEEAAKMQLDLDRAKKLKNDPLFKADQVEARLRGNTNTPHNAVPTTTPVSSSTPLTSKQRMDAAMAKLRQKK